MAVDRVSSPTGSKADVAPLKAPPHVARPAAQQKWAHSCCSKAKLQAALRDPTITAIEADIMMPEGSSMPIMAHPSLLPSSQAPKSDLDFATFLERSIGHGKPHLKLDFKEAAALEPCLQLLAKHWPELERNSQAIWLNADVLPGPNARGNADLPPRLFLPLCLRYCPHAFLSLGWRVGAIGPEEAYSQHDVDEMASLCAEYALDGASLVFAVSLRIAERSLTELAALLARIPQSQLLLWTGTGEAPVRRELHTRALSALRERGVADRVGFDIAVAHSILGSATSDAIDCTFFTSRWMRYFCCGQLCCGGAAASLLPPTGERQGLLNANGTAAVSPPTPASTPDPKRPVPPVPLSTEGRGAII